VWQQVYPKIFVFELTLYPGGKPPCFVKTDMVCYKRLLYVVGFLRPPATTSGCLLNHSCPPRYYSRFAASRQMGLYFPIVSIWRLAGVVPLKFVRDLLYHKIRVLNLSCGISCVMIYVQPC